MWLGKDERKSSTSTKRIRVSLQATLHCLRHRRKATGFLEPLSLAEVPQDMGHHFLKNLTFAATSSTLTSIPIQLSEALSINGTAHPRGSAFSCPVPGGRLGSTSSLALGWLRRRFQQIVLCRCKSLGPLGEHFLWQVPVMIWKRHNCRRLRLNIARLPRTTLGARELHSIPWNEAVDCADWLIAWMRYLGH